ncbi:hypothetical protein V8G54_012341 [Vigna mungo]|uniref:Chaperone DnaJ C-terminal domain-containing protein n=1 Tax=Vigna mungo TaxID=3915 RepID=A0AAQ3NQX1_VIGMU
MDTDGHALASIYGEFYWEWKQVETVEGLRDLQIPSGIQPGDSVKLSRLGVPDMNRPFVRGNHYFIVNVLIPKDISGTERVLVEQLASLRASNKRDSLSSGDNGIRIPKGKFNEFTKRRDPRGDGSSKGIKNVDSLWGSIKNFLRYISVVLYIPLKHSVGAKTGDLNSPFVTRPGQGTLKLSLQVGMHCESFLTITNLLESGEKS